MLNKARIEITKDQKSNPVRTLLLRNRHRLKYFGKQALDQWLELHPKMKEIYWFKEMLYRFYRTRGIKRASRAFTNMTDQMALSELLEIKKASQNIDEMADRDPSLL